MLKMRARSISAPMTTASLPLSDSSYLLGNRAMLSRYPGNKIAKTNSKEANEESIGADRVKANARAVAAIRTDAAKSQGGSPLCFNILSLQ